ncbi:MAG: hypothetical protein EBY01_02340 [Actinobacteria bacterium]|nr:hypothetical protein [Actinomycetota bacterium]
MASKMPSSLDEVTQRDPYQRNFYWLGDNRGMSEILPNITSDEVDLEKDDSKRDQEIKEDRPPHHEG